jgi:hypothetical protein
VRGEHAGIDLEQDVESLYRVQGARLWRSIALSTGSRDVADDAVAEAFAQAIARGDAIHDPAAWIWRAAFGIAAGELKERSMAGLTGNHGVRRQVSWSCGARRDRPYAIPPPALPIRVWGRARA